MATEQRAMTCAEAVRQIRGRMRVVVGDLVVEHPPGLVDTYLSVFGDDRYFGESFLLTEEERRVIASALIGQDLDAMQAVVDAALARHHDDQGRSLDRAGDVRDGFVDACERYLAGEEAPHAEPR